MSRKVIAEVVVEITVNIDEGVDFWEALHETEYQFYTDHADGIDLIDTEIKDYKILDSK